MAGKKAQLAVVGIDGGGKLIWQKPQQSNASLTPGRITSICGLRGALTARAHLGRGEKGLCSVIWKLLADIV